MTTTSAHAEMIKRIVILIADSRSPSRSLLRSMLVQLGAKSIYEANDGAGALDAIRNVNPDLVFIDWDLPVVSAPNVIGIIRTPGASRNPGLPIIVMSNSGESSRVNEAIKLGAQQFLVRPISLKILEQRLIGIRSESRRDARAGA